MGVDRPDRTFKEWMLGFEASSQSLNVWKRPGPVGKVGKLKNIVEGKGSQKTLTFHLEVERIRQVTGYM